MATFDHEARLVHGDFGAANILVRQVQGAWQVAAVIDWEFAFAGTPLFDLGHFLRYERRRRPVRSPPSPVVTATQAASFPTTGARSPAPLT